MEKTRVLLLFLVGKGYFCVFKGVQKVFNSQFLLPMKVECLSLKQ